VPLTLSFERFLHSETDVKYVNTECLRIVITRPFSYAVVMRILIRTAYISVNSKSQDKIRKKFLILWGYGTEGFYHSQKGLLEDFVNPFFIP